MRLGSPARPYVFSARYRPTGEAAQASSGSLEEFLASGPTPVCIGFGSMSQRSPEATTRLVLDAVRRSGVRAILLSGWGGLTAAERPATK